MDTNIIVDAVQKRLVNLPKAECASIHIDGNKGKVSDGKLTATAFIIMVKCNGEWRPENEWLHRAGMKTARRVYTDINKAKAAKEEIVKKWGVPTSSQGKKREEEKQRAADEATKAAMEKVRASLKALGMSDEAVNAIIANAK